MATNLKMPLGGCAGDLEMSALLRRLEETEAAMERIVAQMDKVPLKPPNKKGNSSIFNFQVAEPCSRDARVQLTY